MTPGQAGIIPLKLKRRLHYNGYVMHQFVRLDAVLKAVDWLVENNQLYCGMNVDHQWNESCMDEDSETWSGKTPVSPLC